VVNGLTAPFITSNTLTATPMELNSTDATIPVELLEVELTTRQAAERYGCENNYSTFHNRMVKLGIKPERRGRQSFLGQQQIQLLDRLDEHLRTGGTFGNFVIEEGATVPMTKNTSSMELVASNSHSIVNTGSIGDMEIVAALQAVANANYDILTPQKRLKEAAEDGFVLTTEQVSRIVGLSHSTVSSWKTGTRKLGFHFHKEHEGSSVVWKVSRAA
jgi:DNA-binding transcriptional regulator YiaG